MDKMKKKIQSSLNPEVALRNIVMNMEIEGFQVSDETLVGCRSVLVSGEEGKSVADGLVRRGCPSFGRMQRRGNNLDNQTVNKSKRE